jgi:hypothetical protein
VSIYPFVDTYRCAHNGQHPYLLSIRPDGHEMTLTLEARLSRRMSFGILSALVVITSVCTLTNRFRSFVRWSQVVDIYHPRAKLYFNEEHQAYAGDTIALADEVNRGDCRELAIDSYFPQVNWKQGVVPRSLWVYPLFALIHADGSHTRLRFAGVHNLSQRYEVDPRRGPPCAVIRLSCERITEKLAEYGTPGATVSLHGQDVLFQYLSTAPKPSTRTEAPRH